jgi:hypothetical protein
MQLVPCLEFLKDQLRFLVIITLGSDFFIQPKIISRTL